MRVVLEGVVVQSSTPMEPSSSTRPDLVDAILTGLNPAVKIPMISMTKMASGPFSSE